MSYAAYGMFYTDFSDKILRALEAKGGEAAVGARDLGQRLRYLRKNMEDNMRLVQKAGREV